MKLIQDLLCYLNDKLYNGNYMLIMHAYWFNTCNCDMPEIFLKLALNVNQ